MTLAPFVVLGSELEIWLLSEDGRIDEPLLEVGTVGVPPSLPANASLTVRTSVPGQSLEEIRAAVAAADGAGIFTLVD